MPRAALTLAAVALATLAPALAPAQMRTPSLSPHLDPSSVPGGCSSCHRGHGVPGSPMLRSSQVQLCQSCHGSRADRDRQVAGGAVSANASPLLLSSVLTLPFVHPMAQEGYSEHERGVVVCTSCHTPHRGLRQAVGSAALGQRRLSTKDPTRFEYELCESCHGNRGITTQSFSDLSRLLSPSNRSFHPVEAPSRESSPSVLPSLTGREINCTDCHGNSDPRGPAGPHGSTELYILRARYATTDGSPESPSTFALCYSCHRREAVLSSSAFPEHRRHIVELKASCATCHNAHGSVQNRALIRFGEETVVAGVSPSGRTGRLAFDSTGPGAGNCYLSCHGADHAPASYGSVRPALVTPRFP